MGMLQNQKVRLYTWKGIYVNSQGVCVCVHERVYVHREMF